MERYSKWRDPGTGIQPFLPPLPSHTSPNILNHAQSAISYCLGIGRFVLLMAVVLVHLVVVDGLGLLLAWAPRIRWLFASLLGKITTRSALFVMGYYWISSPEVVQTKRGKTVASQSSEINPGKGDIIVCNWTSYVELIWLTYKYNPTFLLSLHSPLSLSSLPTTTSSTGRHTGTGSASLPTISNVPPSPLLGFLPVPLLTLIQYTGYTPASSFSMLGDDGKLMTLEEARAKAQGPVCLLMEGTTGNGRGVLRFSEGVGKGLEVPVKGGKVWVVYFKHPPPTPQSASATLPAPTTTFLALPLPSPLPHLLTSLLPTLIPRSLSTKILHPASSPSSGDFLPSEVLGLDKEKPVAGEMGGDRNVFSECVMALMLQMGRTKKIGMGWEDKEGFLEFRRERERPVVKMPAVGGAVRMKKIGGAAVGGKKIR